MAQLKTTKVFGDLNVTGKITQSGKGLIEPAPEDGKQYARKDDSWVEVTGDVEDAPVDGKQYARKDASWVEVTGGVFEPLDFPIDILNNLNMSNFPDPTKNYTGTVLADLRPFNNVYVYSSQGNVRMPDIAAASALYPGIYTLDSRLADPIGGNGYWLQTFQFTLGDALTVIFQRAVRPGTGGTFQYDAWYIERNSINDLVPGRMIPYAPTNDNKIKGLRNGQWVDVAVSDVQISDVNGLSTRLNDIDDLIGDIESTLIAINGER